MRPVDLATASLWTSMASSALDEAERSLLRSHGRWTGDEIAGDVEGDFAEALADIRGARDHVGVIADVLAHAAGESGDSD